MEYSDESPLRRAPAIPAGVCCCLPSHHRSPSLSAALGCSPGCDSPPSLKSSLTVFSPWFFLSWSPGTTPIRASTWGWHFCLKEIHHVKKGQTYEREDFLLGAWQCWDVSRSIRGLGLDLVCQVPNWEQCYTQQLQLCEHPGGCENWGRHRSRQETFPGKQAARVEDTGGAAAPQNVLGFWFPNQMPLSSKPQPQHIQMMSLQTACTANSFCFNRTIFWLESVSYEIF